MKSTAVFAGIFCALVACLTHRADAAAPALHRQTLPNGIRVAYLHVKDSPNVSIFTFLPMGLAHDEVDRTQWAHLIEHLVIRTTIPGMLADANAETQPDHMRLDFYGTRENWKTGLAHHAKWIGGLPFTDVSVREEPARANSEADNVTKVLATHKFATAAWNQVSRHGRTDVKVKGDILGADKAALEAYRDKHLVITGETMVCIVGGVEPREVLAAAGESLGAIKSTAKPPAAAQVKPGHRDATWDLDATHVLLTWPTPGSDANPSEHAALMTLARLIWMQTTQDPEISAAMGMVLAGSDMRCPESTYFFVSAGVHAEKNIDAEKLLAQRVEATLAELKTLQPTMVTQLATQLATELDIIDPAVMAAQAPNIDSKLVEAQIALVWASGDYRLDARRDAVVSALRTMTLPRLQQAAAKYLTPQRMTSVRLSPAPSR